MSFIAAMNMPNCDDCPMSRDSYRYGQCGFTFISPGCKRAQALMAPPEPGEKLIEPRPGGPYVDVRNAPWLSDEEYFGR